MATIQQTLAEQGYVGLKRLMDAHRQLSAAKDAIIAQRWKHGSLATDLSSLASGVPEVTPMPSAGPGMPILQNALPEVSGQEALRLRNVRRQRAAPVEIEGGIPLPEMPAYKPPIFLPGEPAAARVRTQAPVGTGPSLPSNTATNTATNTADAFSMFARRAAMGAAIGGGTQAAWGLGPGDFSAGHIVGGAAGGAVLGMAGGYGASRARSAGYLDRLGGRQAKMTNRFFGGQLSTSTQGMRFVGGRMGGARRTSNIGWGRAGLYTGATMGSFAGAWAGGNMFGNSRRRKSMGTLSHYGELF